jgi:hypothetical protein
MGLLRGRPGLWYFPVLPPAGGTGGAGPSGAGERSEWLQDATSRCDHMSRILGGLGPAVREAPLWVSGLTRKP